MESCDEKINIEIPSELFKSLSEASKKAGTDESDYAARVVLEYLKSVKDSADAKNGGNIIIE
jgi:hypothetical protein